jgi:hypothetical protein
MRPDFTQFSSHLTDAVKGMFDCFIGYIELG